MNNKMTKMAILVMLVLCMTACSVDKGTKEYNQGIAAMKAGDYQKAYELIGIAISKNTEEPLYYINYGTALVQLESYDEAINSYKKAITDGTEKENLENNKRTYRGLGIAYYFKQQYNDAETNLEKALEIGELPDLNLDTYMYLGAVKEAKGEMKDALKAYESVLSLDNKKLGAYVGKYNAEIALAKYEEAEETLEDGLRCGTTTVEDQHMHGKLQFYSGNYEAAISELEITKSMYAEAYLFLGQSYMQQDSYDEAITNFEEYIEKTGEDDSFILCKQLAKCYIEKKKYKKAVTWLDEGVDKNAEEGELQDLRFDQVEVYEKLDKTEEALKLAKKYAEIYNNDDRFANKIEELEEVLASTGQLPE